MTLAAGPYRALLQPAAVAELVGMMGWGGFSVRAQRAGQSPLARLYAGEAGFGDAVALAEAPAQLQAPLFQQEGFAKPPRVELVRAGRAVSALVSPRSAREFGLEHNGAEPSEAPVSLALGAGTLAAADALAALGTGIWIGNLWYLNWSERSSARLTGMTRFGSFWVRDGRVVAPLARARFDDSLYRMLGSELQALGDTADVIVDPVAYDARDLAASAAPAALVRTLRIAL
ncbi:MAG: hypothetical protein JSW68_04045 [Burkholderiales bacterium]|nr:MAG: hypothetical protein JSW68_04045 [Burkholderiales bacterium]